MSQSDSKQKNSSRSARQRKTLPILPVRTLGELMESFSPEFRLPAIRTALNYSTKLNELRKLGDDIQVLSNAQSIGTHQEEQL